MTQKTDERQATQASSATIESVPESVGGSLNTSETVVATVAGLAARNIKGIHALGKSRLVSFGEDLKRGVEAEVGETQAALDVDVVIEYGCNVRHMAAELRSEIARQVDQMAGRKVVEVNINVIAIHLDEEKPAESKSEAPRVQ